MTRFQFHIRHWSNGCGSDYCDTAMRKVFYRGSIPCDLLFVGEAPGKTENILGLPFKGPAGKLLDRMIQHANVPVTMKVGFTNLVCCIPRTPDEEKVEPDADQMKSCKPRLEEIIKIASPRLIFAVGSHSRDALKQGFLHSVRLPTRSPPTVVHIPHPAWILRQSVAFQGLEMQRVSCTIRDAVYELEHPPEPKPQREKAKFRSLRVGEFHKRTANPTPTDQHKQEIDAYTDNLYGNDEIPF